MPEAPGKDQPLKAKQQPDCKPDAPTKKRTRPRRGRQEGREETGPRGTGTRRGPHRAARGRAAGRAAGRAWVYAAARSPRSQQLLRGPTLPPPGRRPAGRAELRGCGPAGSLCVFPTWAADGRPSKAALPGTLSIFTVARWPQAGGVVWGRHTARCTSRPRPVAPLPHNPSYTQPELHRSRRPQRATHRAAAASRVSIRSTVDAPVCSQRPDSSRAPTACALLIYQPACRYCACPTTRKLGGFIRAGGRLAGPEAVRRWPGAPARRCGPTPGPRGSPLRLHPRHGTVRLYESHGCTQPAAELPHTRGAVGGHVERL
jgi:hypothetical protein